MSDLEELKKDLANGENAEERPPNGDATPSEPNTPEPPAVTEFDPIVPEFTAGGIIVLGEAEIQLPSKSEPGVECKLRPIRTRQLLAIGRIITGSTRPLNVNDIVKPFMMADDDEEGAAAGMAAVIQIMLAVPHSEREFINLIKGIVNPVDRALDEPNLRLFYEYLDNPEPDDIVKVFGQVAANERTRMQELGKALRNIVGAQRNAENSIQGS